MKHRTLALAPLGLAAGFIALTTMVPAGARLAVLQGEVDVSKALAGFGMVAAALAFDRGDYLRRSWGVFATTYLLLLARDGTLLGPRRGLAAGLRRRPGRARDSRQRVCRLRRLQPGAGLGGRGHAVPWIPVVRRAVVAFAIGLAIVFAGPSLWFDLRDLVRGATLRLDAIPSDLGDILALPVVAPVALTALAVRHGSLRWPWMLLTVSLLSWLVYDAIFSLPGYVAVSEDSVRLIGEQFHIFAGTCACAAGLAQRKAVTDDDDPDSSHG